MSKCEINESIRKEKLTPSETKTPVLYVNDKLRWTNVNQVSRVHGTFCTLPPC